MNKPTFGAITMIVATPAFLFARTLWPLSASVEGSVALFFSYATAIESIFLGIGVAFVTVVLITYRRTVASWHFIDWASFISIAWILLSGYPHDNMHIANNADLHGLIPIEIFFHGTLAIAALFVTYFFLRKLESKSVQS